jgi:hypothetical protein
VVTTTTFERSPVLRQKLGGVALQPTDEILGGGARRSTVDVINGRVMPSGQVRLRQRRHVQIGGKSLGALGDAVDGAGGSLAWACSSSRSRKAFGSSLAEGR